MALLRMFCEEHGLERFLYWVCFSFADFSSLSSTIHVFSNTPTTSVSAALAAAGDLSTTIQQMDDTLGRITGDGKKCEAIKCQLRFRKKVLKQKGSRDVFAFSRSGKALPVEQLMTNLKQLIASVPGTPVDDGATSLGEEDDQHTVTGEPTPDGSSASSPCSQSPLPPLKIIYRLERCRKAQYAGSWTCPTRGSSR